MILPFVSSGFTENAYGVSGPWCWIKNTEDYPFGTIWKFILFYIPFLLSLIYNITVTVLLVKVINKEY